MSPPGDEALPARVLATPLAEDWIGRLTAIHGPLMFHQSGGCCDGSAPMCYPRGDFRTGASDLLLGEIAGDVPVYIGADQYAYWSHTQIVIDVVPGRGSGFSVESTEGIRFLTRSRVFSDAEHQRLLDHAPATGAT